MSGRRIFVPLPITAGTIDVQFESSKVFLYCSRSFNPDTLGSEIVTFVGVTSVLSRLNYSGTSTRNVAVALVEPAEFVTTTWYAPAMPACTFVSARLEFVAPVMFVLAKTH